MRSFIKVTTIEEKMKIINIHRIEEITDSKDKTCYITLYSGTIVTCKGPASDILQRLRRYELTI